MARIIKWKVPRSGRSWKFTIERRYIGIVEPGLLYKWHAGWVDWHVYRYFQTEAKRDALLKRFSIPEGREWCAANFEYRAGFDDSPIEPPKKRKKRKRCSSACLGATTGVRQQTSETKTLD